MCMRRVCHVWKVGCSLSPRSSLRLCMKTAQPCTQCNSSLHQTHDILALGSLVLQSECAFTSRSVAISPPLSELGLQTGVLHLAFRWVLGISSQVAIVSQQVLYFTELSSVPIVIILCARVNVCVCV